jgi:hypothetical protein
MRPKVVLMVLGLTVGLVALAAVLRAVLGGHGDAPGAGPTEGTPTAGTNAPPTSVKVAPSNTVPMTAEMRAAQVEKEQDQIRELLAEGAGNPHNTGLLLAKLVHREPEVRKAAIEALVLLNDTNAIPGMQQALTVLEDPRDKAALMDAIDQLKLPDLMSDLPPMTNEPPAIERPVFRTGSAGPGKANVNPAFMRGPRSGNRLPRAAGSAPSSAPGQPNQTTQPAPAAPDAAPPR